MKYALIGLDRRDRRQHARARPDKIADLRPRKARDPVDGRLDGGVTQVDLRLPRRGALHLHIGGCRGGLEQRSVALLLADGPLREKVAVQDDAEERDAQGSSRERDQEFHEWAPD